MYSAIMCEISEADEAATDRETALDNLRSIVSQGETMVVIDCYERAAWAVGATVAETEQAIRDASAEFAKRVTIVPRGKEG